MASVDPAVLKEKLIAVLSLVQADSGLACPALSGAIKPVEIVPKFDCKVWPVVTTILATEIGATIQNHVNIVVDETIKLRAPSTRRPPSSATCSRSKARRKRRRRDGSISPSGPRLLSA
jgi:hypothetical protein